MAKVQETVGIGFHSMCSMIRGLLAAERVPYMQYCRSVSKKRLRGARKTLKAWGFKKYKTGVYRRFWEAGASPTDVLEIYVYTRCRGEDIKQPRRVGVTYCPVRDRKGCVKWGTYIHASIQSVIYEYGKDIVI